MDDGSKNDVKNVEKTENSANKRSYTDPVTGKFVVGNPGGGRPKGSLGVWNQIREVIDNPPPGLNYRDALAKVVLNQALKGSWPFMQAILDRDSAMEVLSGSSSADDMARDVLEALRKADESIESPP